MNFIEAVNKFYEVYNEGRQFFVVRKSWGRSPAKDAPMTYLTALGLDKKRNLRIYRIYSEGEKNLWYLMDDDYNANDWAVFDADTWKIREA